VIGYRCFKRFRTVGSTHRGNCFLSKHSFWKRLQYEAPRDARKRGTFPDFYNGVTGAEVPFRNQQFMQLRAASLLLKKMTVFLAFTKSRLVTHIAVQLIVLAKNSVSHPQECKYGVCHDRSLSRLILITLPWKLNNSETIIYLLSLGDSYYYVLKFCSQL